MIDRRIALDARDELGPALLLHLVARSARGRFDLGQVQTRPWDTAERWRLSVGGGARLQLGGEQGLESIEGVPCEGEGGVTIASEATSARSVRAAEVGLMPPPGFVPATREGVHALANGHAQALMTALAFVSARLELRWAAIEVEIAPGSQALEISSMERALASALPELAGKFTLRASTRQADRDRILLATSLGGAPGLRGVHEGLGDALASPRVRDRVFDAPGDLPRSSLLGAGQLAWRSDLTQAVGPLACMAFDYDARDLQAARMVELAEALLDEEGDG